MENHRASEVPKGLRYLIAYLGMGQWVLVTIAEPVMEDHVGNTRRATFETCKCPHSIRAMLDSGLQM